MNNRDPYDILGISSDSEMSVIKAAFIKLVEALETNSGNTGDNILRSELEWAYSELSDPNKRNEYRNKKGSIDNSVRDISEIVSDIEHPTIEVENKNELWSVLLSTGIFLLMIGTIGYGLYFVGAARSDKEYFGDGGKEIQSIGSSITPVSVIPTGIPEISVMHTATVESLKVTATHEALVVYSEGLTATNYAKMMPSATPTSVLVQACPNAVSVNIRTGPSTAYTILGQLLQGDCFVVYGRNEESSWFAITEAPRPSMNDGWVSGELIDMDSSGNELEVIYLD